MDCLTPLLTRIALLAAVASGTALGASAQKHSLGSAPPTAPVVAPPRPATQPLPGTTSTQHATQPGTQAGTQSASIVRQAAASMGPIAAVSTGLGAIQFAPANLDSPAPQSLTRQLASDDERTRMAALATLGAPGQYLAHGHVPFPHSMQLDVLQLGNSDDLDALLTVELDQHVLSAVLIPEGSSWHRVATLTFASSFNAGNATPSNFVRPLRSWLEPGRYRAVYHATVNGANDDFTENEADLRVINGHAEIVMSFVSGARQCDATGQLRPPHQTCEILQRWFEPDPTDPKHHFNLITGAGHFSAHEAADPLSQSRNYRLTRLRAFTCQPFIYSESAKHFEPIANAAPCAGHEPPATLHPPEHPEHTAPAEHP